MSRDTFTVNAANARRVYYSPYLDYLDLVDTWTPTAALAVDVGRSESTTARAVARLKARGLVETRYTHREEVKIA